jgi:hypothetical protein
MYATQHSDHDRRVAQNSGLRRSSRVMCGKGAAHNGPAGEYDRNPLTILFLCYHAAWSAVYARDAVWAQLLGVLLGRAWGVRVSAYMARFVGANRGRDRATR